MSCWKRSQLCSQPMPCRESLATPGTCIWCLCRIGSSSQVPELVPSTWHELAAELAAELERRASHMGADDAELVELALVEPRIPSSLI